MEQGSLNKMVEHKTFGHFKSLKHGSIKPQGRLNDYLRVIADSWSLLSAKNREGDIFTSFWTRWDLTVRSGGECGSDYSAYFADGFVRLCHLAPESELAKELETWLKNVLASQDPDGYLGAMKPVSRWQHWLEIFHQNLMLEALLYHYEITGDQALLDACERSAALSIAFFYKDKRNGMYGGHGLCAIRPMLKLYAITGKQEYLEFAKDQVAIHSPIDFYLSGHYTPENRHNVVESENVGFPAILYEYSGEEKLLKASLTAWEKMQSYIGVEGSPHGFEAIYRKRPRANVEHCGTVEWSATNQALLRITGDVKFADAVERAMFNGYPGSKSADALTLAYYHAPNQLVATDWSAPCEWPGGQIVDDDGGYSKQYYTTATAPLCCSVISPRALPYFVDSMVMIADNGLAIVHYGSYEAKAEIPEVGTVKISMDTDYPFEDEVRIFVNPDSDMTFALQLRIPQWCLSASIKINGEQSSISAIPGQFAVIERKWCAGDCLTLNMEVPIRLEEYPESHNRVAGYAIMRGALLFVMPIKGDWIKLNAAYNGPGKDPLSYNVLPKKDAVWNYGLIVDKENPEKSITLKKLNVPENSLPWEHPPIALEVKAKRILNWEPEGTSDHPMTPGLPFKPMRVADEVETINLVPYGFTQLRMSYLPLL
jgi:hypothetical protein